jgi:hypothetical protein
MGVPVIIEKSGEEPSPVEPPTGSTKAIDNYSFPSLELELVELVVRRRDGNRKRQRRRTLKALNTKSLHSEGVHRVSKRGSILGVKWPFRLQLIHCRNHAYG